MEVGRRGTWIWLTWEEVAPPPRHSLIWSLDRGHPYILVIDFRVEFTSHINYEGVRWYTSQKSTELQFIEKAVALSKVQLCKHTIAHSPSKVPEILGVESREWCVGSDGNKQDRAYKNWSQNGSKWEKAYSEIRKDALLMLPSFVVVQTRRI